MTLFNCLECGDDFDTERSLHAHIKKHDMFLHDYYVKHYGRKDLLTGDLLPFKNKEDYFNSYFLNRQNQNTWFDQTEDSLEKQAILLEMLEFRVKHRNLKEAPNEVELIAAGLPSIKYFKKHFGSYTVACEAVGVQPMFTGRLPKNFSDPVDAKIFIDTREQQPLEFSKKEFLKLDLGDYAIENKYFNYTFVDRKSEGDYKSTLSQDNLERFRRELSRAREQDSFIFVVVESDIDSIEKNNHKSSHKANLKYIYHNMRVLQHEYRDCCQFVFSGNRENSVKLIPRILFHGRNLWNVDLQFYINEGLLNGLDRRKPEREKAL